MNMFSKAKPAPKPVVSKKSTKLVKTIIGLEMLGFVSWAIKSLKAIEETAMAEVKLAQKEVFVEEGMKISRRPENFTGKDGLVTASCELRARSTNSPLSDDEIELYEQYKLPTRTINTVTETFIINPAYLADGKLLERVGEVLGKIKGIPDDFIQKQEGVSKVVADDTALDTLFAMKDKNVVSTLLPMVGVLAVKPTLGDDVTTMDAATAFIGNLLKVKSMGHKAAD